MAYAPLPERERMHALMRTDPTTGRYSVHGADDPERAGRALNMDAGNLASAQDTVDYTGDDVPGTSAEAFYDDEEPRSAIAGEALTDTDIAFNDFRAQVRTWLELDTSIKQLQTMLRDRKHYKNMLTEKIIRFMRAYDVKTLDMGEAGYIRSRKSYVKSPLTQKMIRDGINSYLEERHNSALAMQLTDTVFNRRQRIERLSLRHVPPE
jgi:hypothetical protein